jgi:DNA mismatch endonuclease (patch repair protein)
MMAAIRGKNTRPELTIRRGLHRMGFRFRIHDSRLPGKPDLVFSRYRAALFINGCFWHGHDCYLFKWPGTRVEFWRAKITRNCEVDRLTKERLSEAGWRVYTVWECAMKGKGTGEVHKLLARTATWLKSGSRTGETPPASAPLRQNVR